MKSSRAVMVGGASAAILTVGWVTAPEPLGDIAADDADSADAREPDATASADTGGDGGQVTVEGDVVSNARGSYQVRLVLDGDRVVGVEFPISGTEAAESRRVNAMALPELEERIVEAQSWDVEYVSGASFTSPAMVESARTAFEDAGL